MARVKVSTSPKKAGNDNRGWAMGLYGCGYKGLKFETEDGYVVAYADEES